MPNNNQSEEVERIEDEMSFLDSRIEELDTTKFTCSEDFREALMKEVKVSLTTHGASEYARGKSEERERIEEVFKEKVPPHAMDLEDSVWLKRLLNKAFLHENIYK